MIKRRYRVRATVEVVCEYLITAETEAEAREKANAMDALYWLEQEQTWADVRSVAVEEVGYAPRK